MKHQHVAPQFIQLKIPTATRADNVPVDGDGGASLNGDVRGLEGLFGESSLEVGLISMNLSGGECVSASATDDGGVDCKSKSR